MSLLSKEELKLKKKFGIQGVFDDRAQVDFAKLSFQKKLNTIKENPDSYRHSSHSAIMQLAYLFATKGKSAKDVVN